MCKYNAGRADSSKRLAVLDYAGADRSCRIISGTADYRSSGFKTRKLRAFAVIVPVISGDSYTLARRALSIPSLFSTSSDQQRFGMSRSCIPLASETSVANSPVSIKRM